MTGLRAIQTTTRRRPIWDAMVLGGVERLTRQLMEGVEFSEEDLEDMQALRRRLQAFDRALTAREKAEGILVEEPETEI